MSPVVVGARVGALVSALVIGFLGGSPAALLAQQAGPSETLVARCDLPVVDLFSPMPGDVLQPGSYLISGLALDPLAPADSSGIDQVSFYLGDRDQGGTPLGTVVPSTGLRQADFSVTVMLPTANAGAPQQFEAFAHSALSGKETELALPITLGPNAPPPSGPSNLAGNAINTNPGVLPDICSADDVSAPAAAGDAQAPSVPAAKPSVASVAPLFGIVVGTVTACQGGVEQPVAMATVQVQGTSASGISDLDGVFAVIQVPAPGTYTISVSDGGKTASRMYVPVAPGETIDIGTLQVGADVTAGCAEELPPTN